MTSVSAGGGEDGASLQPGCSYHRLGVCVIAERLHSQGRAGARTGGQCIKTAGPYALDLAQVRERHEMHIVCVHLNKDKCQISMAPGGLHVR